MITRFDKLAIELPEAAHPSPNSAAAVQELLGGELTGVQVGKLLPIPDISNKRFPDAKKYEDRGLHRILYRFSPADYTEAGQIWKGTHPEDGSKLEVVEGMPQGATPPDLPMEPQLTSPLGPDIDKETFAAVAKKLFG
jgi:Mn-containing catalase